MNHLTDNPGHKQDSVISNRLLYEEVDHQGGHTYANKKGKGEQLADRINTSNKLHATTVEVIAGQLLFGKAKLLVKRI
jgi:hypothetical protein